jgi:hypothetical protein
MSEQPTQTLTPLEAKRMRFELIRNNEGPRRRLTVRKFIQICHLIENGMAIYRACESEGVTYALFRLRVTQSERLAQRLKKAEQLRASIRFEHACASIMDAGEQSWMAHAWWLERSYPQLFALRTVNRSDPEAKQAEPEIPAEILARHRRLILETLAENQAAAELKALPNPEPGEHSTK